MYCTASQLISYVDSRLIGDLCADQGLRLTPDKILTDANVASALSAGSGVINSYALISERYTPAELSSLTGDDANLLSMIVAWLAFGILCQRRGRDGNEQPGYQSALLMAQKMRDGQQIFNVPADVSSGIANASFPSFQTLQQVNSLRQQVRKYFPVVAKQTAIPN